MTGTCESEVLLLLCGIEAPIDKQLIEEVPVAFERNDQSRSTYCCGGRDKPFSGTPLDALPAEALPPMMAFPGKWKLDRVEGDMDGVAKDMGISWGVRVAGAQMGWGVGQVAHSFAFSDGRVTITSEGPVGTFAQDLPLDGLPNETVGLGMGTPITAAAQLEDCFLHVDSDDVKCGRYVLGGGGVRSDMLVMQFTTESSTSCHVFSRCT